MTAFYFFRYRQRVLLLTKNSLKTSAVLTAASYRHHTTKKKEENFLSPLGDSARIQTWNRLIRSQVLYSVELRSRIASANIWLISDSRKYFLIFFLFFLQSALYERCL